MNAKLDTISWKLDSLAKELGEVKQQLQVIEDKLEHHSSPQEQSSGIIISLATDLALGGKICIYGYTVHIKNKAPTTNLFTVSNSEDKGALLALRASLQQISMIAETKNGIQIITESVCVQDTVKDYVFNIQKELVELRDDLQKSLDHIKPRPKIIEINAGNKTYLSKLKEEITRYKNDIESSYDANSDRPSSTSKES